MTFDVEYYNNRLSGLRAQSEFYGIVDGLLDAIDLFDNAVITYAAAEAERTGSPVAALEALGDYVQRGSGSIVKGAWSGVKMIWNMGVWVLKTVKNMTVFAIRGFKGTVGSAIKRIEEMGDRIQHMQNNRIATCCHMDTITRLVEVFREHIFIPEFQIPEGKIAQARQNYIQQFNGRMRADAQVNNSFALANPPGGGLSGYVLRKFRTLADVGGDSAQRLIDAGNALLTSEKILKERLDEVSKSSKEVEQITKKIRAKGKYGGLIRKDKYVKDAGTVQVLKAAFVTAILAQELKYLKAVEDRFVAMVYSLRGKSKNYVTDDGTVNPVP